MLTDKDIIELRNRLKYDFETGIFTYKIKVFKSRTKLGEKAGCVDSNKRVVIKFKGKIYKAHRLAWLFHYGELPNSFIDHIDGNPSNNAIANLRLATCAENGQNRKKNKTQLKMMGVSYYPNNSKLNPYEARIVLNKKLTYLGSFPTAELAHAAYIAKKREIHPFFVE